MAKNWKLLQESYYQKTAQDYDQTHLKDGDEHFLALHMLSGLIDFYQIQTVLDVGAGTGRVAQFLSKRFPNIDIHSIEPVEALRDMGYAKGMSRSELTEGDVTCLNFNDAEFDLVCAFGVFHHLPEPKIALSEMGRVSSKYIFISYFNTFGSGNMIFRHIKQLLNLLHLWQFAVFIKTKGKMFQISEGDGLFYSFSTFNLISLLRHYDVYPLATSPSKGNIYRDASHVALFAIKKN